MDSNSSDEDGVDRDLNSINFLSRYVTCNKENFTYELRP